MTARLRSLGNWSAALFGLLLAWPVIVTPLDAVDQSWLALGGIAVFLLVNRIKGRRVTIVLAALSGLVSLRYIHWRVTETVEPLGFWQGFFMIGLVLAEAYAVLSLFLGYFQTLWPLPRRPAPLPADPASWPTVDVFIPTYNESLDVVKPTVLAALALDWPADKFNVYILDDGRRPEFRAFAEACGAGYVIRPDNKGAKAGNINHALTLTEGEYIAIFDCDHVPTRAFLQLTLGWMLRDPRLAMVQTPHHFYSLDPFERNLSGGRDVPNEGLMFYGLVQPGNDLWNATFFCGSCAVIRREAIEDAGGVPTETVTEDCHLSLRMQCRGWNTAFLRLPLAAGLATERLILHIGQRMRWARGMLQIMRIENPLFAPGLRWHQRVCYFSAMLHFLFALPRVVFLTAPLAFLLLGHSVIAASPLAIIAYAGPHIFHSVATGSRVAGAVRHSFWSEIYETVLALWLLPVTVATLLDPRKGKFNVTEKGGLLPEGYFDWRAVWPTVCLALALLAGVASGVHGIIVNPMGSLEFQAYLLNGAWALLCLVPALASIAVGRERAQVRASARVEAALPAVLVLPDGRRVAARTRDISLGGAALRLSEVPQGAVPDGAARLELAIGGEILDLPARFRRLHGTEAQVSFEPANLEEEARVVLAVFSRADAWLGWDRHRPDRPLRSLIEVVSTVGAVATGRSQLSLAWWRTRRRRRAEAAVPVAPLQERRTEVLRPRHLSALLLAALLAPGIVAAQPAQPRVNPPLLSLPPAAPMAPLPAVPMPSVPAAPAPAPVTPPEAQPPTPAAAPGGATRRVTRTLRQLGLGGPMQLRGTSDLQGVQFGIRADEVVTGGRLILSGATSPALIPELSQLAITLNEQFIGAVQPDRARPTFGPVEFPLNPVFFTELNRLNFRFSGRYAPECNDPLSGLLWTTVSDLSTVQLTLERLPLPADLARLPEPFFDARELRTPLRLPFVIAENAGNETLRAAVIASSWFASLAEYRGASFPVAATPPAEGHAVMVAVGEAPEGLGRFEGPTVALLPNPNDRSGLLLVIGGRNQAEAVTAATALAAGHQILSGARAVVDAPPPSPRRPYDAPRWLATDRPVRFGELVDPTELQASGYAPGAIAIPIRTAPDLYSPRSRGVPVEFTFRAPPGPVLDLQVSRLDASLSGAYLRSVPLRAADPSWPWSWIARQTGWWDPVPAEGRVTIPAWMLSGRNELQLRFDMRPLSRGDCVAVPGDIRASIDPDGIIDLSRAHRFAAMPNLAFFATAGFPFTRLADLAETAVVIPERPSAQEVSTLLGLIGGLAAQVGVPATGLAVVRPGQLDQVADRDLILLGAVGRLPALAALLQDAPVRLEGGRLAAVLPPDRLLGLGRLFGGDAPRAERDRAAASLSQPADSLGLAAGFESPLRAGRSVVLVSGSSPAGVESMAEMLRDPAQLAQVQGDLVLLNAGRIEAFRFAAPYTVGTLPFWLWPDYYLAGHPHWLLLGLALASLLIALPIYRGLRRRAARRLRARI